MAVSKQPSGFECEFVEKPPKAFQTECLICLLILREPYQVICCGKSFCRSCIECVKSLNNPCPHCNKRNFNDFPNKGFQQSLYQLEVRCPHHKEGCEWTGELDNHLNLEPVSQPELTKGCVFAMVRCSYCTQSHQRKHILIHKKLECSKRPYTCEHCKVYKSTFEDVTTNHKLACVFYPVKCSNKCGAVVQQQNLQSHLDRDCPLTLIECTFHYAGCEAKLPRKFMGEHLRIELVNHTSMMAASYQRQLTSQQEKMASYKQQKDEDRKRINELVKEKKVLEQRITKLEREQKLDRTMIGAVLPEANLLFRSLVSVRMEKAYGYTSYSEPFYTHQGGYKLCLRCTVNQPLSYPRHLPIPTVTQEFIDPRDVYSDYQIVGFHLMRGEFDDELRWPFRAVVTLQMLRQDGFNNHFTREISLFDFSRVKEAAMSLDCRGEFGFQRSRGVFYSRFVKNNSLYFKILQVVFK